MAAAARSLAQARRVVLVTGFVARPTWAAETDGPSGTVVLGRALRRLGARVAYLADPPVAPLLEACLRALGEPRELIAVPAEPAAALRWREARVRAFGPTHLVAIERPGRAVDGGYYNARGMSVATADAPLDALFLRRRSGLTTIGVGDGGNEIGMGRVRARVVRDIPNGEKIASVVRTDHLIVGGTSNWGAWGVVAHLALGHRPRGAPYPEGRGAADPRDGARGAVDGLTGVAQASVDNLPLGLHQALLETLRGLIGHMKAHRRPVAVAREEETA